MTQARKSKTLTFRISAEELDLLKQMAKAKGSSLNAFVKEHIFNYINKNFNLEGWEEHYLLESRRRAREEEEGE